MHREAKDVSRFLSSADRNVLALSELAAGTVVHIARQLRLPTHVVQYSLKKLRTMGVLSTPRVWIDLHRLGYSFVTIYLRPRYLQASGRRTLLSTIARHPSCTWLFETSGHYHLACSLTIRDISELATFFDVVGRCPGIQIERKAITIQRDFEFFGRKYLWSGKRAPQSVILPSSADRVTIEEEDIALLHALGRGVGVADGDLRSVVEMSRATAYRRLASLRERSIVRSEFYWLDSRHFGRQLFILRISGAASQHQMKEKLWAFSRPHPCVLYVLESIGAWDFEIGADLSSVDELSQLLDEIPAMFPTMTVDIEPIPVSRFLKVIGFPDR